MMLRNLVKPPFSAMPQGMASLFFIQMFASLSYSVLYSSLILYMHSVLGMSKLEAATITGVFIAYNYALHLMGGYLAGRYLSNRLLFCTGMLVQVLGCVLLMQPDKTVFILGIKCVSDGLWFKRDLCQLHVNGIVYSRRSSQRNGFYV